MSKKDNLIEFKRELLLDFNIFQEQDFRKNKESVAQLIQNICIIEKGTYPNAPQLGVGIENYEFELLDQETIFELEEEIKKQITVYVPNEYNVNTRLQMLTTNRNNPILAIYFFINSTGNKFTDDFLILFGKSKNKKKLVSEIII